MNRCFQRLDRGCTSDRYRTKKLSQKTLENLYRGPSFLLAERYAQHCVFICVAMTYSTGMPILYAIACLSFIITCVECRARPRAGAASVTPVAVVVVHARVLMPRGVRASLWLMRSGTGSTSILC